MRMRRVVLDGGVALALVAYASAFPRLTDFDERTSLTIICVAATLVCLQAAIRATRAGGEPRAGAVWYRFTATGVALAGHHALFFWRVHGGVSATVRDMIILALGTASVVIGGSALVLVIRPLLSYSATRRQLRWMGPVSLLGMATVPLADPYLLPVAGGAITAFSVVASLAVCTVILVALANVAPALVAVERTAELWIGTANVAFFGVTSFTVFAGYSEYWALPGIAVMVLLARAALTSAAREVGCPIAGRPIVSQVRYRRAAWAAAPVALVIPAVALGADPSLAIPALVATLALSAGFAEEMSSGVRARSERPPDRTVAIARQLQAALVEDQLTLLYQPIVAISDRRVVGFESLLRWIDGPFGDVGAEEILVAARWQGVLLDLERWAVARAVEALAVLRSSDLRVYVAVNVTPASLQRPGFAEEMVRQLAESRRSLAGITIEIVEYGHIDDWAQLRENVATLKAAGASIALDDFGTGTSNVQYLSEIDADVVKLDRSLVRWAGSGGGSVIVQQVVHLARSAGLDVVAEGVEDEALHAAVVSLGVDLGQGYLYSRPVGLDQAVTLVGRMPTATDHPTEGGPSNGRSREAVRLEGAR